MDNPKSVNVTFPPILAEVLSLFSKRNAKGYLIGPRARDLVLGADISSSRSFDLTVDGSLQTITDVFATAYKVAPLEIREDKVKHLSFKIPFAKDEDSYYSFHVGPYRNYLPPLRSLRGQNLKGIILDLATREVTIQAFAFDDEGCLIDPFGGSLDLADGLIRPVFPSESVFRESPSWLLKTARYVARYGLNAAHEVIQSAERDASNIIDVPREIWQKEMGKVLTGAFPGPGLQFLADTRVLSFILPEVASMVTFSDSREGRHKDVWEHTKQVVTNADPSVNVRWAALCHDMGKVWTKQVFRDGKVHFFRHEDMSAILFEGISQRFRMEPVDADRIHYIIENHSRINLYREDWTDSAVRRLIRDVGAHLDDLIAFSKADLTSKRSERVEMIRALLADLQIRVLEIRERDEKANPLPKGIGNAIMQRFGLAPGPGIGKFRDLLIDAIDAGKLQAGADDEVYLAFLADNRPE